MDNYYEDALQKVTSIHWTGKENSKIVTIEEKIMRFNSELKLYLKIIIKEYGKK